MIHALPIAKTNPHSEHRPLSFPVKSYPHRRQCPGIAARRSQRHSSAVAPATGAMIIHNGTVTALHAGPLETRIHANGRGIPSEYREASQRWGACTPVDPPPAPPIRHAIATDPCNK